MKHKISLLLVLVFFTAFACQSISTPTTASQDTSTQPPQAATQIPEPTLQPASTEIPTSPTTSPITEIIDDFGVPMVLVPAGEFIMGNNAEDVLADCKKVISDCQLDWFKDQEPPHQVFLDEFYMDIYEVTNILYKACVDAGACAAPQNTSSKTHSNYYGNSEFSDFPVIYIDWSQATAYCKWRGANLPSEAQWEKAARGTDGRTYPWGNKFDGTRANFCDKNCPLNWSDKSTNDGYADVAPVGSFEEGKSPYGIYDLAGNVFEWTADWYSDTYYQNSPFSNPLGPDSGRYRVLHGGSWSDYAFSLRAPYRLGFKPGEISDSLGFRCAKDATP